MKNKKLLYILIPATVILWGIIVFKIVSHLKNRSIYSEDYYLPEMKPEADSVFKAYKLLANYNDPFRINKRSYSSGQKKETKKTPVQTTNLRHERRNQQRIFWPSVTYSGTIINMQKQVALIQIDMKNFLMMEGEEQNMVKLQRLFPDSVIMVFEGETKTIIKK